MLKRVRIRDYKSLIDVDVSLRPLTVLFGPNSAGKSNFLDALQLLSNITTSKSLKSAFDPPYRGRPLESFTFGPAGISDLLDQDSASFSIEIDVELSESLVGRVNKQIIEMKRPTDESTSHDSAESPPATVRERHLRYFLEVQIIPRSGIIRITNEYLAALNAHGEVTKARKPFLERMKNRLHLRMEGQAHPTYYERYLDHSILSTNLYAPHYPHMVAMREELSEWFFFYLEPRERMRSPNPVKEAASIGAMGEDLAAFLNTLQAANPQKLLTVSKSLHTVIPSIDFLKVDINKVGEAELKIVEHGREIPASVMSEGSLRIIGLLALSGSGTLQSVIGFEEPENGIHPQRVRLIARLLEEMSQADETTLIVTTHSPAFLDVLPSEALYSVQKVDGKTSIVPYSESIGPLSRRTDIQKLLEDSESLSVSQRIMRGDFDAA